MSGEHAVEEEGVREVNTVVAPVKACAPQAEMVFSATPIQLVPGARDNRQHQPFGRTGSEIRGAASGAGRLPAPRGRCRGESGGGCPAGSAPACCSPSLFPGVRGRISLQALHALTQADVLAHLPQASKGLNTSRLPASELFFFFFYSKQAG